MEQVTVDKGKLLTILKENRQRHRSIFLEAQKGYRRMVIVELDKMLSEARKGEKIRRHLTLPEPQDHTADYDTVIAMVEMSVNDNVVLEGYEFKQYVLDKWDWSSAFSSSSSSYCSGSTSSSS